MDGTLTSSVVLLIVTVSPLFVMAFFVWEWHKEIHHEARLRRTRTIGLRK
jgi:hypothetical protein